MGQKKGMGGQRERKELATKLSTEGRTKHFDHKFYIALSLFCGG